MKKTILSIICLLLLLSVSALHFTVTASVSKEPEAFKEFFDAEEYTEIETALQCSEKMKTYGVLGDSVDLSRVTFAYKVYSYMTSSPSGIIGDLEAGADLSEHFTNEYQWMILTDSNASIRVVKEDGNWIVAGYRQAQPKEKPSQDIHPEEWENAMKGIEPESVTAFQDTAMHMTFLYIRTAETAYVVPFASRPDFSNLENGQRYTLSESGKLLKDSDMNVTMGPDENGGGGVPSQNVQSPSDNPIIWPFLVGIAVFLLIVVAIILIMKKVRR